jgi:hypothetical protein
MNKPTTFWRVSTYEDEIRSHNRREIAARAVFAFLTLSNMALLYVVFHGAHR